VEALCAVNNYPSKAKSFGPFSVFRDLVSVSALLRPPNSLHSDSDKYFRSEGSQKSVSTTSETLLLGCSEYSVFRQFYLWTRTRLPKLPSHGRRQLAVRPESGIGTGRVGGRGRLERSPCLRVAQEASVKQFFSN
jgi:hypothetical protein